MDGLIWFVLLALLAEILGTLGGFGSSLFFVPLASMFFDFHTVLGVTAIFHVFSNISKILLFRKGFDKNVVLKMGVPAVVFVGIGALLTKRFDSFYLEMIMSIFMIGLSILFLIKKELVIAPSDSSLAGGGIFSGFLAGLLGTGGAVRGMVMAAYNLEKSVFIASSAMIDLGVDLTRSAIYFSNGFMRNEDIYLIPVLLLVGLAGSFAGKKILEKVSQENFKTTVLLLILGVGIFTLIKTLN